MQSKEISNGERPTALIASAPVIVGASIATCVMWYAVARRFGSRPRLARSRGIVPTMLMGALAGAVRTVPRLLLVRLLDKLAQRGHALRA